MNKYFGLITLAVLILVGISLDISPIQVPDGIDKIGHFLGFLAVTLMSIRVLVDFWGIKFLNFYLFLIALSGGAVAALSEFVQRYVPMRSCSFEDWITNVAGIYIPVLIVYFIYNIQVKKAEAL